ncbi:MAG: glycosyltransferase [Clostridium sp.]|nr:glycosyltransferase [Clostridium sp.]
MNLGISKAKLVGLGAARGKYVLYMDGDDWLEKDALKNLAAPAIEHDLDLVIGNHYRVLMPLGIKKLNRSNPKEYGKAVTGDECRKYWRCFLTAYGINSVAYWAKLYKREVILKAGWEAQPTYDVEDHKFNCTVFPHVRSLMFIDKPVYYWRWGGLTSGRRSEERAWNFIEKYCDLNLYKEALLRRHGNEDMIPMVRERLISYFYGTIALVATGDADSSRAKAVKSRIAELISHPAIEDAMMHSASSHRFEYIRKKDVDSIYACMRQEYKARWKHRLQLSLMQFIAFPFGLGRR